LFKKIHVFRIKPKRELLGEIVAYCREHNITSGIVLGMIGSLENARLNFVQELPARFDGVEYKGPLEIVCAQGSIALKDKELIAHIHMQISSKEISRGGHLAEAMIMSTAEVVIGELDYQVRREFDSYTGLNELSN
jgi:predicted DNA-binding protein with PD1-like motif